MPYIKCIGGEGTTHHPDNSKPLQSSPMRKIERLMNAAITAGKDWKLDNTEVLYFSGHDKSQVYLHGNLIAEIGPTYIELFDGGWQTPTTKSRLNAILREHGLPGEGVFQKKGQWFFSSNDYGTIPFFSGMRIA
jgi:hypothetical protein